MSKLYIVPTPIGNLEDMTLRAIRVLREADLVLAEDTRVSSRLLQHFEITTPMSSHHKFNEHRTVEQIAERIASGQTIALISDAGTPGISDPGFMLVRECLNHDIEIECLPGATSVLPALLVSGLPVDRFHFEGFLPVKKGRQTRLDYLAGLSNTIVLFESPHRMARTLRQLAEHLGRDRHASVSREITKVYEEHLRGSLGDLATRFEDKKVKGELVIVVAGA
jgi:16S rRNA (cytidine1402-2'-O)-methyltransferase